MAVVAEEMVKIINDLETGPNLNVKLEKILKKEIRRRLNRYELINRQFCEKHKMDFNEFKEREMVRKSGYSYEIESDFCDWEMAISGIRSLKKDLAEISEDRGEN